MRCPYRHRLRGDVVVRQRPAIMDPLHITEFGSDRYLEKFNQSQTATATPATAGPSASQLHYSQFILPIRGSSTLDSEDLAAKHVEVKRPEKKSFFRKFHSKPAPVPSQPEQAVRRPSLTEPVSRRR